MRPLPQKRSVNPVKIPVLYLDTSVIGGYFDDEFKDATQELWRQMENGKYRFATSVLTEQETQGAPDVVRDLMKRTFDQPGRLLTLTQQAVELTQAYMDAAVVPVPYADDARHVAIAVVHEIHVVVSWNFKHLVNRDRRTAFNAVNLLQGYPSVDIISPLELVYDAEEEKGL